MTTTRGESPLSSAVSSERQRLREEYAASGFSTGDYEYLRQQADDSTVALKSAGLTRGLDALKAPRGVINAVVRLLHDPAAEVAPPTNAEVYAAGLLISRLSRLTRAFAHAPEAWFNALASLLESIEADADDIDARLALLEFAAACRGAKVKIAPNGAARASLDLEGWKCGVAAVVVAHADALSEAANAGEDALRELRLPGIIIFEITSALPPAPRLARVANEETALAEMRRHLDTYIEPRLEAVAHEVNTDFAFAGFFSAVMSSVVVSSGRAFYAWCPRAANLCPPRDARLIRLERFMHRLSRPQPRSAL